MNSKDIFDHVRSKFGGTQAQYDALLRILNSGASIVDLAVFVGLGTDVAPAVVKPQGEAPKSNQTVSGHKLTDRDIKRLEGVDADLVKVVKRAIELSPFDFMVVEGMRTLDTQKKYLAQGKTTTMKSRHLIGQAVDLAPLENGAIDWSNSKGQFDAVAVAMKKAAKELGVTLTWGGDWKTFIDKPHFQIEK